MAIGQSLFGMANPGGIKETSKMENQRAIGNIIRMEDCSVKENIKKEIKLAVGNTYMKQKKYSITKYFIFKKNPLFLPPHRK